MVSLKAGVLSRPFFSAAFDIAMTRGSTPASCFFTCGVMLGVRALANFSNCAFVMTVLQSAAGMVVAGVFAAVAGFVVVPAAVFATAGWGFAGQTPVTVSTTASGGTEADRSGSGAGASGLAILPIIPVCGAGGAPGAACPQASAPN